MKILNGYKTYIIAALLALVAMVEVLTGGMTLVEFVQSDAVLVLLNAAGLGAMRHGIAGLKK